MSGDRKRMRVLVSGRVQGVFFRYQCADRARSRRLGGWVRNLPDGRVEAVFEGDPQAVDVMVEWCHRGPNLAAVEGVEATEESPTGEAEFRITP